MSFLHPVFMGAFFYVLYLQRNLGGRIFGLKEKGPEFADRPAMLEAHVRYAYILLGMIFVGMLGGIIVTTAVLQAPAPFFHTYGHGFFGLLAFAGLVAAFILGKNIKNVVKPKIRGRFLTFHMNFIYIVAGFGLFSLVSGIIILTSGVSK